MATHFPKVLVLLGVAAWLFGCERTGTCGQDEALDQGTCRRICNTHEDCGAAELCSAGFCVAGGASSGGGSTTSSSSASVGASSNRVSSSLGSTSGPAPSSTGMDSSSAASSLSTGSSSATAGTSALPPSSSSSAGSGTSAPPSSTGSSTGGASSAAPSSAMGSGSSAAASSSSSSNLTSGVVNAGALRVQPPSMATPEGSAVFVHVTNNGNAMLTLPAQVSGTQGTCTLNGPPLQLGAMQSSTLYVQTGWDNVAQGNWGCVLTLGPSTSADSSLAGLTPPPLWLPVLDDDPVDIHVSPPSVTLYEAPFGQRITVMLGSQSLTPVVLPIFNPAPDRLTVPSQVVLNAANMGNVYLDINPVADNVARGDARVTLVFGPSTGDPVFATVPPRTVDVQVMDDDRAEVRLLGGGDVMEGAQTAFSAALTSQPLADVTLLLAANPPGQVTINPSQITVTPAVWNIPVQFTVTAVDTTAADGDRTVTMTLSTSTSDATYAPLMANAGLRVLSNERYIWVTNGTRTGNMGGISGADALCNSDPARPSSVTNARAVLVDGNNRRATTAANTSTDPLDWPLLPAATYQRPDGVPLFTTNGNALFPFNTGGLLTAPVLDGPGVRLWTGLTINWLTAAGTCARWTTADANIAGSAGDSSQLDADLVRTGGDPCSVSGHLLCVE